jgi:hypothetical protein
MRSDLDLKFECVKLATTLLIPLAQKTNHGIRSDDVILLAKKLHDWIINDDSKSARDI